jgi:hypothetical protein
LTPSPVSIRTAGIERKPDVRGGRCEPRGRVDNSPSPMAEPAERSRRERSLGAESGRQQVLRGSREGPLQGPGPVPFACVWAKIAVGLASALSAARPCTYGGHVMTINPNNPFNFSYAPGQNFWGAAQLAGGSAEPDTHGATHSWSSISAGTFNTADNYFAGSGTDAGSSLFNYGNSLSGYEGPGNSYVVSIPDLPSPISPTANGGSGQSGPDSLGDVTVVNTAVGLNPTFAADNSLVARARSACMVVAEGPALASACSANLPPNAEC